MIGRMGKASLPCMIAGKDRRVGIGPGLGRIEGEMSADGLKRTFGRMVDAEASGYSTRSRHILDERGC